MTNKTVLLPGKQQAAAQALVDSQGRVLTPGSVTDSSGVFSFDLTALPKAYTYDGSNNVATVTYGPDRNGRSVRITKTWAAGVLQSESAPVLFGTAAAGLTLTGANSGVVGNASADITVTVTPAGSYFSPFIFTPNDNIGDGSFQPPSVELSFAAPSAKFKYTALSEGARLLSGTCDQGGLVPGALNFTANPTGKALAPAQVTATVSGTSVTLTWPSVPAANNGGTPVKNYLVKLSDGSARVRGASAVTHTFNDLQPGVQVTGSVAAITDTGVGSFATSGAVTPVGSTQPGRATAPRNLVVTAGNGTISIAFDGPASDGGAAVINFTATDSATNDQVSGNSPLSFAGRANGVARTISVVANTSAGPGTAAVSNSVTPSAPSTSVKHRDIVTVSGNNTYGFGRVVYSELNRDLVIRNPATNTVALQLGSRDADNFANGNADYSSPITLNPGEELTSPADTYQYFIRQAVASAVAGQTVEIERTINLGA